MKSIKHVAIIMDGNGRWGQKKKKRRYYGHIQGLKTLENIVNYTLKKNINDESINKDTILLTSYLCHPSLANN